MSRELCFGESGGLGEEMSGGETGTFRLFRGEVCLRFFWGGGINGSVSALRNIKRACLPSIDKYDACLGKNKSNPLNCVDVLREVCLSKETD